MEKLYYTAKEVAEMLDVSVSHAYKVIREANRAYFSTDNNVTLLFKFTVDLSHKLVCC